LNKAISLIAIFFFVCGTFVAGFSSVLASSDYVENSWSTKTSMSQARSGLGVIAVEGKIYAIGGHTSFDDLGRPINFVGTNECYDPKTDMWVTLEPMPTARHNFAIAECQNKIYCIGGYIVDGSRWVIYDIVEMYDPVTNSWSTKATLPPPFIEADLAACVVNGRIYVFATNAGSPVFMYDPISNLWTTKTHKPNTTLHYYAPIVVDDKITLTSLYLTAEVYDPATNKWVEKESESQLILIFNRIFATAVTTGVYAPQRVYVLGKQYGTTYLTNWNYDPVNGTQLASKGTPVYRENFGAAMVDDVLYVIGGDKYNNSKSEILSVTEQYVPMGYYGATSKGTPNPFTNINSTDDLKLIVNIVLICLIAIIVTVVVGIVVITHFAISKKGEKQTKRKIIR
jgi:N-acetylneuraminic acid mutarotase